MAESGSYQAHQTPGRQSNRRQGQQQQNARGGGGGQYHGPGSSSAQKGSSGGGTGGAGRQWNGHGQYHGGGGGGGHGGQSRTPNGNRRKSSNSYSGSGGKNSGNNNSNNNNSNNDGNNGSQSQHTVERRGSQDMRELTAALMQAREGTGDVTDILMCSAFRPRLPGLTKMLSKLGKDGSWKKALELFEAAVNIGMCEPDTALTNAAVSACDKGGQWAKALEYFDKFERMGIKRDAITYSATINALGKGKQWEAALKVFDHMKSSGVHADVVTCCSLINALEKSGQWEMAEALFYYMKGDPVPDHNEVVAEVGGGMGGIGSTVGTIGDSNANANADAYGNGNGNGNANSHTQPSPNSVLRSVLRHNSLVSQLATVNEDNVEVPDDLGSLGFVQFPDDLIGTPVSVGSEQSGLSATSNTSFNLPSGGDMGTTGTNARRDSASSAYSGSGGGHVPQNLLMEFASLGVGDGSHNQIQQLYQGDVIGTGVGIGNVLRRSVSCFPDVNGQDGPLSPSDLAKQIDFSHARGVHPNRVCCNALMGAFARARPTQWKKAVDFVSYLWTQDESIQPDVITYNTALKACSSAFQLKQIEMLLADMNDRGVSPNTATFQFIIEAATESHSSLFLQNVIRWLEDFPQLKDKCSSQLVVACIRCGMRDEALEIFEDRLTSNSHGVSDAAEAVFSGLIIHKDCDAVIRLLDLMCEMRTLPSMNICSSLIDFLSRNNHWEAATNLLENMISSGSVFSDRMLSVSTANSILRAMGRVIKEGASPQVPSPPSGGGPVPPSSPMNPKDQATLIVPHAKKVYGWFGTSIPCRANQETFGLMIQIYSAAEDYVEVLMTNQAMSKQGCYPDQETMSYILLASFERGDTNNAIRLMSQLIISGVVLSNAVISRGFEESLARSEWHLAQMICESLEEQDAPKETIGFMYQALLHRVLASGDNATAIKLVNFLQDKPFVAIQLESIMGGQLGSGISMGSLGSMSPTADPNNQVALQHSTDSSHSGGSLFAHHQDYHQSVSVSSHSQSPSRPASNKDQLVYGLLDEWLSAGFLPEDVANDVMSMRGDAGCPTPEMLMDIVCRVAESNNGVHAADAVRMCCSLHTRAGALDFYTVPNMYSRREDERHGWQQDIAIHMERPARSITAMHVIVASWMVAAQEAVSWDLGAPNFAKFNIHISASSSELGNIAHGLMQLLTRGHSAVIPEGRPGSGGTSATKMPRFHDTSFVTLFQQDENSGVIEIAVDGLRCLVV